MFKKEFVEKFFTNSDHAHSCYVCKKDVNKFLLIKAPVEKIIVCKDCCIDSDATSKETYIKSLNEMHLEKDLLSDVIMVYDKYINSSTERMNDYKKFKEQWDQRKDIRNIDG